MPALPVDSLLPEIIASLRSFPNLVIEAPPGAGKTTRVPPALLDAGLAGDGEVWVLEPRRLAARMSARRVAEERNEKLGETVGYQVRFDEVSGPRTRLRFLTEGVLTRRLLSDPQLKKAGIVILDEFHERHLQADIALALLRRLQQTTRPELKLIAMSATLEAAPVAGFLNHCPVLRAEGRRFEVAVEHAARHDERPLADQVAAAVRQLISEGLEGDVLVFLPGAAEIRRAQAACSAIAAQANMSVLPLHGDLSAEEQDRAVRPSSQRKIILSTNVAETSITIDGVVAVIDSGLARMASHSPWSGLPTLNVARVSKASAVQRAGRAGRTRPGRCLRLYTAQDYAARPDHETPEVQRLDLAEAVLELHAAGISDPAHFAWFEAPSSPALDAAESLLQRLGAIEGHGLITETGKRMLRFPLHPRQARLLVEAEARGVAESGCVIAALIGERDLRLRNSLEGQGRRHEPATSDGPSDLLALLDLFAEAERVRFAPERLREMNLDPAAVMAVDRVSRQLRRILGAHSPRAQHLRSLAPTKDSVVAKEGSGMRALRDDDESLLISILSGYPDRVARRRRKHESELLLSTGGTAQLSPSSVVRSSEYLVAVEVEERRESGLHARVQGNRSNSTSIRLASAMAADWLLDLFTDAIRETTEVSWNAQSERVEAISRLLYDQLVIDETKGSAINNEQVSHALAEAAMNAGLRAFIDEAEINRFRARVEFVAATFPEAEIAELTEADAQSTLADLCIGKRSFAELRAAVKRGELMQALQAKLTSAQASLLARMAPDRVNPGGRRQVRVNYESGKPPWIASRLQDFFGATSGPVIAGGRVPVVLHLLAPNQRPVQVTTDLAGFWQRTYPQVRRELSRRYPRHAWPENPLQLLPEEKGKR